MLQSTKGAVRAALRTVGLRPKRQAPFIEHLPRPFRPPQAFLKMLAPELIASVTVTADVADEPFAPAGEIEVVWERTGRSVKWRHYFEIYEQALAHLKGKPVRLLEIGVFNGGSLRMWREYLGPQSVIVGADIDPRCQGFEDEPAGIHVRIGAQGDPVFLRKLIAELGPFDAVVDDGSHRISDMVTSFGHLFGAGLRPGGVYIVEDTHAPYWTEYRDLAFTFADFGKELIDFLHAPYWTGAYKNGDPRTRLVTVPAITTLLESVQSFDSVTVLRKRSRQYSPAPSGRGIGRTPQEAAAAMVPTYPKGPRSTETDKSFARALIAALQGPDGAADRALIAAAIAFLLERLVVEQHDDAMTLF